jgi:hypothetical protein
MPNQRLRSALVARDMTTTGLAATVGVDPKSVERWLTQDRVPHRGTRARVASALGHEETYLWPSLRMGQGATSATSSELVTVWHTRDSIPGDVWRTLSTRVAHRLDVLVYSGGFVVEAYGLPREIRRVSANDGQVRILLGDAGSEEVRRRGVAEGLPTLPARAASTLDYLRDVRPLPGVEVRLHDVPLYASIYRFDDDMLVNPHTHGISAKDSPVFHYERVGTGGLFGYYEKAFDRVWETSHSPAPIG